MANVVSVVEVCAAGANSLHDGDRQVPRTAVCAVVDEDDRGVGTRRMPGSTLQPIAGPRVAFLDAAPQAANAITAAVAAATAPSRRHTVSGAGAEELRSLGWLAGWPRISRRPARPAREASSGASRTSSTRTSSGDLPPASQSTTTLPWGEGSQRCVGVASGPTLTARTGKTHLPVKRAGGARVRARPSARSSS
jgi:hypothetical protein